MVLLYILDYSLKHILMDLHSGFTLNTLQPKTIIVAKKAFFNNPKHFTQPANIGPQDVLGTS